LLIVAGFARIRTESVGFKEIAMDSGMSVFEPRYIITHQMLKSIGSIEGSREMVENAAIVPAFEVQFRREALNRTVHHGTHLEGNELSKEQAAQVMGVGETLAERAAQKAGIIGRDRDVQEVINYRRVVEWIDELGVKGRQTIVPSEQLLKDIHDIVTYRILPEDQRGQYRQVEVVLKNSRTGEVTFRPPTYLEVNQQMQQFFRWLLSLEGKQHHPVLRAGITHYELVRIHPFTDGNGRTARAMAMLILYLEGYDVKRFFSLDEYFDKDATEYYKALQSVGQGEEYDLTFWLEYFTRGLSIELDRVKQQVLRLSRDLQLKTKIGKQVALSERQIKILEMMQRNSGRAVSADLELLLPMVSVDTILRDLKSLMKKGLIRKKGQTKGAFYQLAS
jgi:Fic family protein